jgi:hypothetical protein
MPVAIARTALLMVVCSLSGVHSQGGASSQQSGSASTLETFRDAVSCSVLLDGLAAEASATGEREWLLSGSRDAYRFASFLLQSRQVIDEHDQVLGELDLEAAQAAAWVAWMLELGASPNRDASTVSEVQQCIDRYRTR